MLAAISQVIVPRIEQFYSPVIPVPPVVNGFLVFS